MSRAPNACWRTSAAFAVNGYRAPSFSIGRDNLWALECLREAGYRYSSSIYPIQSRSLRHARRAALRVLSRSRRAGCWSCRSTTVRLFNRNLPAGGGGYFRSAALQRFALVPESREHRRRQPCIFYFHPWEIDPGQPRQRGASLKTRFRHYVNLSSMERRIRALFRDFTWDRMDRLFLENAMNQPALEADAAGQSADAAAHDACEVRQLQSADFPRWDAFVAGCPEATFFPPRRLEER